MARAALLAALIAFAPTLPEGCAKLIGKGQGSPPAASAEPRPVSVTSAAPTATATATAPPVWAPPDLGGAPPPTPAAAASVPADVAKARTLSEAGDHKKVRALLEKKVKAGKANHEEATILLESCLILRDKGCVEAIKTKHPDVEAP